MNNARATFENSPANPLSACSRNNHMNDQIRQMEWSRGWSEKRDEDRKARLEKETEKVYERCSCSKDKNSEPPSELYRAIMAASSNEERIRVFNSYGIYSSRSQKPKKQESSCTIL